ARWGEVRGGGGLAGRGGRGRRRGGGGGGRGGGRRLAGAARARGRPRPVLERHEREAELRAARPGKLGVVYGERAELPDGAPAADGPELERDGRGGARIPRRAPGDPAR